MGTSNSIGIVGLGNMGGAMARHLVDEEWEVVGFDLDETIQETLGEYGVTITDSPAAVASRVDLVLTSLPNTRAVEAVYLGEESLPAGADGDLIALEMSTIAPETTAEIAASTDSIRIIDAPLSGGPENARIGKLTIMVGGDSSVSEIPRIKRAFDTLSGDVYYLGGLGAGHTTKLLNNQIGAITRAAAFEAAAIAAAQDVDWRAFLQVVRDSSGSSYQFRKRMPQVLNRDFEPGYTVEAGLKDLRLTLSMADTLEAHTPLTSIVYELNKQAFASGFDQEHITALIKLYERSIDQEVIADEPLDDDFLNWRDS